MDFIKLLSIFLFGGLLMILIYYSANLYKNTALSAILSLLPLSIISCYIINKKELIISHSKNLIPVLLITLFSIILLITISINYNYDKYLLITCILIFWIILQYLRIKFFPI